ncbi:hypothetical protein GCM10010193_05070 [Kitasatospora atroaurantiaca]|nr:hypothetical protein [Kitasatospora atroaurantiaca]
MAFLDTLLVSADPDAAEPHEVEISNRSGRAGVRTSNATELVARGR